MPTSACLPFGASGPVNDMEKPILIGSPCWAEAGAAASVRPAAATVAAMMPNSVRRLAVFPGSISYPPAGCLLTDPAFDRGRTAQDAPARIMKSAAQVVH